MVPLAPFLIFRQKQTFIFLQLAFSDKKADRPSGKPVSGSSLEEVELWGGQEVSHLPAPRSGCDLNFEF